MPEQPGRAKHENLITGMVFQHPPRTAYQSAAGAATGAAAATAATSPGSATQRTRPAAALARQSWRSTSGDFFLLYPLAGALDFSGLWGSADTPAGTATPISSRINSGKRAKDGADKNGGRW